MAPMPPSQQFGQFFVSIVDDGGRWSGGKESEVILTLRQPTRPGRVGASRSPPKEGKEWRRERVGGRRGRGRKHGSF